MLFDSILGPVNKWLDGKKTLLGLIGATATLILVIVGALTDGFQLADDPKVILAGISAWLVAIGLGHKASKIETLLKK